jgi:endonuclease/exonuclease/phosphatase family metal-dependent hydrolase
VVADTQRLDALVLDAPADPATDATIDAAIDATIDAAIDAVVLDARLPDAAALDARLPDAAVLDARLPDAAVLDARLPDAPLPPDAQLADAPPPPDAQRPDAPPPPDAQLADASPPPDAGAPPGDTRIRLVAGNISSGNAQAYELPGIRIFQGLAPDVAMIQEFNVTTGTIRGFVDQAFGTQFAFVRGALGSQQIPNGVISRYPILDSGEWTDSEVSNRDFVWARIDVPGPIDLFAISVHLLTANASERNIEAGELAQHIQGLPSNAYVVLGGDFNTDTRSEPALGTLAPVLVTAGPNPADLGGSGNTNANRNKPYDWVLVSPALDALETPTTIGAHQFTDGFVADTRVYTPIADLAPALASDSAATNMQHMAVVRDFLLPGTAAPSLQITSPNGGEVWQAGTPRTITWTASGVAHVRVELITGGTIWTVSDSTPASDGQITLTVPPVVTSAAFARITQVGGSLSDSSDAAFSISIAPPPEGRAFINEVLANEPGTDPVGEFIELVNSGTTDADLSGWTLSDAVAVRHTFAAGTVLHAGRALAVFGGVNGIPAGLTNAIAASSGTLGLTNSGDTLTLASPSATIDSVSYTSPSPDGVSLNRDPDGDATGTFVLHTTLTTAPRSPGVRATGAAF